MSLTKTITIDSINVVGELKTILVRKVTKVMDGETLIAKSNHRSSYQPDTDVSTLPSEVQAIANAVWTNEVIAAYNEQIAE